MTIYISTAVMQCLSLEEAIDVLASIWRGVEIGHSHLDQLDVLRALETLTRVLMHGKELDVELSVAHMPMSHIENVFVESMDRGYEITRKFLEVYSRYGIDIVVMHTIPLPIDISERMEQHIVRELEFNKKVFRYLDTVAKRLGIRIAVENRLEKWIVGALPLDLLEIVDGLESIGICIDTGHAHVNKLDVESTVKLLRDRIVVAHVHDNDGSRDQHLPPMMGSIDWYKVSKVLRGSIPIVLEISCKDSVERCKNVAILSVEIGRKLFG